MNEYIIYKSHMIMLSANQLIGANKKGNEKYEKQMVSKICNRCRTRASKEFITISILMTGKMEVGSIPYRI